MPTPEPAGNGPAANTPDSNRPDSNRPEGDGPEGDAGAGQSDAPRAGAGAGENSGARAEERAAGNSGSSAGGGAQPGAGAVESGPQVGAGGASEGSTTGGRRDSAISGRELPEQRQGDDLAASKYELFLSVAGDLDRAETAYDAELVVSTMLGAAYAIANGDRAAVLVETTEGLFRHLTGRNTRHAALLQAVLRTHTGATHTTAEEQTGLDDAPAWLAQLGTVRSTGTHVFGDRKGAQITYLASFAYGDPGAGGPEHVVAAVVDHELGYVRDLFLAAPAGALLGQLEAAVATDSTLRLDEVDPGELRSAVERHLEATDRLAELPDARSLTSDRALAAQRLRLLPLKDEDQPTTDEDEPVQDDEHLTVADFLGAPEAARLKRSDEESLTFALKLINGFAEEDPLRWDPATVKDFLLEWLPARALLDRADIELIPTVLSAWVRWAGRMSGLEPRDVAQNVAAVATSRAEFAQRARSGSHRSEAANAMIEMLKDGIDVNDDDAVARWLADYNLRSDDQAE